MSVTSCERRWRGKSIDQLARLTEHVDVREHRLELRLLFWRALELVERHDVTPDVHDPITIAFEVVDQLLQLLPIWVRILGCLPTMGYGDDLVPQPLPLAQRQLGHTMLIMIRP